MEQKATVIHIDPQILNGTPVFTGTRMPVATLFEYLGRGASLAEFLADFPGVSQEQAIAALKEAKEALLGRDKRPKQSVVDLLESWVEVDSTVQGGLASWEELKRKLDSDRPSKRRLFP